MKAIINGKRYDTDTAQFIAAWSNSYSSTDFKWCEEDLYRTKKGQWFTAGTGGPMSSYSKPVANGQQGGSAIRPLTEDEARNWLERHGKVSELEEHFTVDDA